MPLRDYSIPCLNSDQFGNLTYIINGIKYEIANYDWTFEPEFKKSNNNVKE